MIAAASLLASTIASAAPKGTEAKAAFDRGVAAYKKADYAAAANALEQSFELEADPDTLYAWAQTERKLDRCDRAIELYTKLLAMDLPAANRKAVQTQIDECKALLPAPAPEPTPTPEPEPAAPPVELPPEPPETPSRWNNPVGLGMVGLGVAGLAVGGVFLMQARGADADKDSANSYGEWQRFEARAASRGQLGVIVAGAGGAVLVAGLVYIFTRKPAEELPVAVVLEPAGASVVGHF